MGIGDPLENKVSRMGHLVIRFRTRYPIFKVPGSHGVLRGHIFKGGVQVAGPAHPPPTSFVSLSWSGGFLELAFGAKPSIWEAGRGSQAASVLLPCLPSLQGG